MKILQVDSSILGDHSVTRQMTAAIVERLCENNPTATCTHLDLGADPVGHFTAADLPAMKGTPSAPISGPAQKFIEANVVVVGAPMYNFTVSTQLKSWMDTLSIEGLTVRFGEKGPEGLCGDKRLIVAAASGGIFSGASARSAEDHLLPLIKSFFGFLGIQRIEAIRAEGLGAPNADRATIIGSALERIAEIT